MCPWWTGEACAMGPQVTCEIVYSPNQSKLWQICGVCPVNVSMTGCACAIGRALPPPLFLLPLPLPSLHFLGVVYCKDIWAGCNKCSMP